MVFRKINLFLCIALLSTGVPVAAIPQHLHGTLLKRNAQVAVTAKSVRQAIRGLDLLVRQAKNDSVADAGTLTRLFNSTDLAKARELLSDQSRSTLDKLVKQFDKAFTFSNRHTAVPSAHKQLISYIDTCKKQLKEKEARLAAPAAASKLAQQRMGKKKDAEDDDDEHDLDDVLGNMESGGFGGILGTLGSIIKNNPGKLAMGLLAAYAAVAKLKGWWPFND